MSKQAISQEGSYWSLTISTESLAALNMKTNNKQNSMMQVLPANVDGH
jgi:hypothetical protein